MLLEPDAAWLDKVAAVLSRSGYPDVEVNKAVPGGCVDLCFSWHVVEAGRSGEWASLIGRALFYASSAGGKPVVLLLVGEDTDHARNARLVAKNNTPPLQVWVLDTRDGTLDMGDGRTIHVE